MESATVVMNPDDGGSRALWQLSIIFLITWCHVAEDGYLSSHLCEIPKSYSVTFCVVMLTTDAAITDKFGDLWWTVK